MKLFNFEKKKEKAVESKAVSEKYNLVIKNNETGEVLDDVNTNGIVGVFLTEDGNARGVFATECSVTEAAGVLVACMKHIDSVVENDPFLKMTMALQSAEIEEVEKREESDER